MASKSGEEKTTGPEDGSPDRRRVSMGKCVPDAPSMTGDSRFPVSMSGLSSSPKRDASARSIPVPGGEIANSIASRQMRRTRIRGARSCQLNAKSGTVKDLTKKGTKQRKQRAGPGLLCLMKIQNDCCGLDMRAKNRSDRGAGSGAQLAESRAAPQDHRYRGLIDRGIGFVKGGLRHVHARHGQGQRQHHQLSDEKCPAKTPHVRPQTPLDCTLPGWLRAVNWLEAQNCAGFTKQSWCFTN